MTLIQGNLTKDPSSPARRHQAWKHFALSPSIASTSAFQVKESTGNHGVSPSVAPAGRVAGPKNAAKSCMCSWMSPKKTPKHKKHCQIHPKSTTPCGATYAGWNHLSKGITGLWAPQRQNYKGISNNDKIAPHTTGIIQNEALRIRQECCEFDVVFPQRHDFALKLAHF